MTITADPIAREIVRVLTNAMDAARDSGNDYDASLSAKAISWKIDTYNTTPAMVRSRLRKLAKAGFVRSFKLPSIPEQFVLTLAD